MTDNQENTKNTPVDVVLKVLQVAQKPAGRTNRINFGLGETGLYNRFVRASSKNRITLNSLILNHGDVIDNHVTEVQARGEAFQIDNRSEFDKFTAVPVRQTDDDMTYDEELFLEFFEAWLAGVAEVTPDNVRIHLVMNTPGALDAPDDAERARRWATVKALVAPYGERIQVEERERYSGLDYLRYATVTDTDRADLKALALTPQDLVFLGDRRQESDSIVRQHVMREFTSMLLKQQQPARVIVPTTVGLNLAMMESARELGIPVVAVNTSDLDGWQPDTAARLNAVLEDSTTTEVCERYYKENRAVDILRLLSEHAVVGRTPVVKLNARTPEITALQYGKNLWSLYEEFQNSFMEGADVNIAINTAGSEKTGNPMAEHNLPF